MYAATNKLLLRTPVSIQRRSFRITPGVGIFGIEPLIQEALKRGEESAKYSHIKLLSSKPIHAYQSRLQDIAALWDKLKSLKSQHPDQVVTLYIKGTPTCGKGQVAREFGEAYFVDKSSNIGFWRKQVVVATLDVKSESRFWRSYNRLALNLGCPMLGLASAQKLRDRLDVISNEVQKKLREYAHWLLIVEGMTAESEL